MQNWLRHSLFSEPNGHSHGAGVQCETIKPSDALFYKSEIDRKARIFKARRGIGGLGGGDRYHRNASNTAREAGLGVAILPVVDRARSPLWQRTLPEPAKIWPRSQANPA